MLQSYRSGTKSAKSIGACRRLPHTAAKQPIDLVLALLNTAGVGMCRLLPAFAIVPVEHGGHRRDALKGWRVDLLQFSQDFAPWTLSLHLATACPHRPFQTSTHQHPSALPRAYMERSSETRFLVRYPGPPEI